MQKALLNPAISLTLSLTFSRNLPPRTTPKWILFSFLRSLSLSHSFIPIIYSLFIFIQYLSTSQYTPRMGDEAETNCAEREDSTRFLYIAIFFTKKATTKPKAIQLSRMCNETSNFIHMRRRRVSFKHRFDMVSSDYNSRSPPRCQAFFKPILRCAPHTPPKKKRCFELFFSFVAYISDER